MERKLFRRTSNKLISGVCSGIAAYANIDTGILRFIVFLGIIALGFFPGVILYIIASVLIPTEEDFLKKQGNYTYSDPNVNPEPNQANPNGREDSNWSTYSTDESNNPTWEQYTTDKTYQEPQGFKPDRAYQTPEPFKNTAPKSRHTTFGGILVIIGVVFILKTMNINFDWRLVGAGILILIGLSTIFKSKRGY